MKVFKIVLSIMISCSVTSYLQADIYEWTDEEGVRHFTNHAPPPGAGIMMKTKELPYDEAADDARLEAEREAQLELERLELAERTRALERREAEAEQKLAEAEWKAEEALREAERLLNQARNEPFDNTGSGYFRYYRDDYPSYYYNSGRYYRNETGSIYFIKRPRLKHYKPHRHKYHQYDRKRNYRQKFGYKQPHPRRKYHRSQSWSHKSRSSIRSFGRSDNGRPLTSRVHSVSPSRRH
jgi:hypothetical protein